MPSRTSCTRPSPRILAAPPSTAAGEGQRQPRQAGPIPSDEQPDPDQHTDRDPHQTVLGTVHRRPPRLPRRPRHSWTRPAPTRASIAGRPRRPLISTARCCRPRTSNSAESLTFPSPGHRPARSSATRACWNETVSGSRTSTRPPPIDYLVGRQIGRVIERIVGLWRRLRGRTPPTLRPDARPALFWGLCTAAISPYAPSSLQLPGKPGHSHYRRVAEATVVKIVPCCRTRITNSVESSTFPGTATRHRPLSRSFR